MVTYMLLIIAYDFVLAIAPYKKRPKILIALHAQTVGRPQIPPLPQSQTNDRSSKRPSDRPPQNHLAEMRSPQTPKPDRPRTIRLSGKDLALAP